MTVEIQQIINLYTQCFTMAFPIAVVMLFTERILVIFQRFLVGKVAFK